MAGGISPETKGKTFDFQLNMVPMIDLLSVMISFLLFTAIWTQVSRIDVKQKPEGDEVAAPAAETDEDELRVLIKTTGYAVVDRASTDEIAGHDYSKLTQRLTTFRSEHPESRKITVSSEDRVPYQELITVMDVCLALGLDQISVTGL
jgi:biopolymer transport protein ExbD